MWAGAAARRWRARWQGSCPHPLLQDAVGELRPAIGPGCDGRIVSGYDHREAEFLPGRIDQVEDALAGVGIQVAGGLVAEQELRPLRQGTRDRNALLLAPGEIRRQGLGYFEWAPTGQGAVTGDDPEALLAAGVLRCDPIVYEDFLPVSAAGSWRSSGMGRPAVPAGNPLTLLGRSA